MPAFEREIRKFVIDNLLYGQDAGDFSNDDSFLEHGMIDSTGVLELVALLEGRFAIKVEDDELDPENLDSINKLVRFINCKTQLATAEANGKK